MYSPESTKADRGLQGGSDRRVHAAIILEITINGGAMARNIALLLIVIGVACVVIAAVGGGLRLTPREINVPPIRSFPRQIALGLIGTIVALCGGLLFSSQGAGASDTLEAAKPIPAQPVPNSTEPVPIKIDRINGQVPRCATFGGQGDLSTDKNLWLAVLTSGSKEYFFRPVVVNVDQHHWISQKVTIGSQKTATGTLFTIYAVLVDNATDQLLRQGHFAGGINALPAGFKKEDEIEVERGPDSVECK
jgi:hypothetical protein